MSNTEKAVTADGNAPRILTGILSSGELVGILSLIIDTAILVVLLVRG